MSLVIDGFVTMLIPLTLTIIIESLVALLLGMRNQNDYINLILINCITNPILNYMMIVVNYFLSKNVTNYFLILFETIVVFVEYKYYQNTLKYKKISPFLLSLILNVTSFGLGLVILKLFI